MSEKIPQHRHCSQCRKAFIGEDRFCSPECSSEASAHMKKRKRQLLFFYAISVIILIIALIVVRS